MRVRTGIRFGSGLVVLCLLVGVFLVVPSSPVIEASVGSPTIISGISASSQAVLDGDYIQYAVTVGVDTGTWRFDFRDVNATEMTIDVTSTIWYFGSHSYTTSYSYQDNMLLVPGLNGGLTSENKTGEYNISTVYGSKHVNSYSYMDHGLYSDVNRTYLVPFDCLVHYVYYGNDTDGNHVVMTLDQTNIQWLKDAGQSFPEIHSVTIYSGADDRKYYDHQTQMTFVGMRDLTSAESIDPGDYPIEMLHNSHNQNSKYVIMRGIIWFDLTSLPSNAIINSAVLSLFITDNYFDGGPAQRGMSICLPAQGYPSRPGVDADFNRARCGSSVSSRTSFVNGVYNDFAMPATSLISGEWNAFYLRIKGDMDNISPGISNEIYNFLSFYLGGAAVQTHRPQLIISYTIPRIGPPSEPRNVTAFSGNGQVSLSWAAPADNGTSDITNYSVYRSANEFENYDLIASVASLGYLDQAVTNSETYWYRVSAVNEFGEGRRADPISSIPFTIPDAPMNLTIASGNGEVTIEWEAPSDNGSPIEYYIVFQNDIALPWHPTNTTAIITGLTNGQDYYFDIVAHNAAGDSPHSYYVNSTPFVSVPDPPTIWLDFVTPTMVGLAWSPNGNGNDEIVGYEVYRSQTASGVFVLIASPSLPSYNDTDVTYGHTYWYRVKAVNSIGASANSSEVFVPVEIAGMSRHDSGKGYSILVPMAWTVEEDATVSGNHVDTLITGPPSNSIQTNILVLMGSDSTIASTPSFLQKQMEDLEDALAEEGWSLSMTDEPRYVEISNHSAVVLGYDIVGTTIHQISAIIIDPEHSRYWIITCTESIDSRSLFDQKFEAAIYGFAITSVPGLSSNEIVLLVIIAGAVGLAVIGAVAFFVRKKKCPRCGEIVEKDWNTCASCGYQLKGMPPSV